MNFWRVTSVAPACFVNSRSSNHAVDPYREVTRAAQIGLAANLGLGIVKLIGGIVGHSFALVADSVNSLGDSISTLVVLYALKVAQRPPDKEHPYGHSRAEGIAASNVALLVVLSAVVVGWEAIRRFGVAHELPPTWTLWIAGSNVVIKEALYHYKMRVGRRTGSAVMMANAWDHRSDALCALAVLIGLAAISLGGNQYIWADEVASLIVATAIIWSGIQLFRQSASELMDAQAADDLVQSIREYAIAHPEVQGVETLWVRKSGLEFFADIHLEVDRKLTIAEGHTIGHRVKDHLLHEFPQLRDVLVHLEPFPREEPPATTDDAS
ncbi:cation diffusion facilitator family transporter [Aeoliella mucimassa]|uniref:Putative cation efflux system protein n=1 Tax=Aeoliella mucimassa TaxID=2527972 RepID=A0A518AR80_9BACT|nr:cation diffusion facilitator family transporter [Aeoliella mucimassa]QDU57215.1 putative cation efflux system protein [Aeoliella mucimassa]